MMKGKLRHIACFTAAMLLTCMVTFAQSAKSKERQKAKLQAEIEAIDKQLKDNAVKSRNALSDLNLVRRKIDARRALVQESEEEIREIDRSISAKEEEIDRAQAHLDSLRFYGDRLIHNAYKNRDPKIWYMYILASKDLSQAFRRSGYLKSLSSQMSVQARKTKEAKEELQRQNEELQALRTQASAARNERLAEVQNLKKEESDSEALVNQLKKDKAKYQKQINEKQRQVDALNRELQRLIKGVTSTSGKGGKPAPVDIKLDAQFAKNKGKLPWPAQGPVVEPFGQRNHTVYKNVKLPFNNGIGIALAPGSSVQAVFDGEVKQIAVMPGYNKCVLVQHGGYFTFYCKLATTSVKVGDKVKTGQTLGTVDTIDGSTQLHFQVWKGTSAQNPQTWLR